MIETPLPTQGESACTYTLNRLSPDSEAAATLQAALLLHEDLKRIAASLEQIAATGIHTESGR